MLQHTAVMALSNVTHNSPTTLNAMANSLDKLVDDILIQILQEVSVHAVLSLRKVSPYPRRQQKQTQEETRRLGGTTYSPNSAAFGTPGFALRFWRVICPYQVFYVTSPCSLRRSWNDARCERSTSTVRGQVCLRTRSFP